MIPQSKSVKTLAMLVLLAILAGCGDQRILDRVAFVYTTGYDLLPEGRLQITIGFPRADPDKPVQREVLSAQGTSSKDARISMSRQTNLLLVNGQLRIVLFSSDFARQGVQGHIDTLLRDPTISPQVKIVVVNGKAQSLQEKNYKMHPPTDKYIDGLLEKEAEGHSIPRTTLYHFERDLLDDGIDTATPIIKDAGDHIEIDGIALFRDDRYVMRISPKDAILFSILQGAFNKGEMSMKLPGENGGQQNVMFESIVSDRQVRVGRGGNGDFHVTISIKMNGAIREYIGSKRLGRDPDRRALEREISEYLSGRAQKLTSKMLAGKTDAIGIGMYVRNHIGYRAWKSIPDWNEELPNVKVDCRIEYKMKEFGKLR